MLKKYLSRPTIKQDLSVGQPLSETPILQAISASTSSLSKPTTKSTLEDTKSLVRSVTEEIELAIQSIESQTSYSDYVEMVKSQYWNPLQLLNDPKSRPGPRVGIAKITTIERRIMLDSDERQTAYLSSLYQALELNQALDYVLQAVYDQVDSLPDNNIIDFALSQIRLQSIDHLDFTRLVCQFKDKFVKDFENLASLYVRAQLGGATERENVDDIIKSYFKTTFDTSSIQKMTSQGIWEQATQHLRCINSSGALEAISGAISHAAIIGASKLLDNITGSLSSVISFQLSGIDKSSISSLMEESMITMIRQAESSLVNMFAKRTETKEARSHQINSSLDLIYFDSAGKVTSNTL